MTDPTPVPTPHEMVIARLKAASRTLLALSMAGHPSLACRTASIPFVREVVESYGWQRQRMRPPVPSAAEITAMDEAHRWLSLIPSDGAMARQYKGLGPLVPTGSIIRRIVASRSINDPVTAELKYSWRDMGKVVGLDYRRVQRLHGAGVAEIVANLLREK